jgi:hypothetical protein
MIVKKNLDLFEESYNEGYESAIKDIMDILNSKTKSVKQKKIYDESVEELYKRYGLKKD